MKRCYNSIALLHRQRHRRVLQMTTMLLALILVGACDATSRTNSDRGWQGNVNPQAVYPDMTIVCSEEHGALTTGGAGLAIAKVYVQLSDGTTYFLPELPESTAAKLLAPYGHEWHGRPAKSRKYFKDDWSLQYDEQGRMVQADLRTNVIPFNVGARKSGPFVSLAKDNCTELVAAFGEPESWAETNVSGMFPLKSGRLFDNDGVPSASYPGFSVDCDPVYATFSTYGSAAKGDEISEAVPQIYVRFANGDEFFLPKLPENYIAWLLPMTHSGVGPWKTDVQYGDGQSIFTFRDGRLDSLHVTAGSKLLHLSAKKEGPYFPINMTRAQIVEVFGKPEHWWAAHPSGQF